MVVFSGWGGGRECFIMSMDESGLNLFDSTTTLFVI